jgi:hypothetical protein
VVTSRHLGASWVLKRSHKIKIVRHSNDDEYKPSHGIVREWRCSAVFGETECNMKFYHLYSRALDGAALLGPSKPAVFDTDDD